METSERSHGLSFVPGGSDLSHIKGWLHYKNGRQIRQRVRYNKLLVGFLGMCLLIGEIVSRASA